MRGGTPALDITAMRIVMPNAGHSRRRTPLRDRRSGAAAEVGADEPRLDRPAPR